MNSYTEKGFLNLELHISIIGAMQKNQSQKIESDLLDFFKERKLNVSGKFSYVSISTFECEKSNSNLDTSTT